MHVWCLLPIGLCAACEPPPLHVFYRLTDGDSYKCIGNTGTEATDCFDISLGCAAVLSVRVIPPSNPAVPYMFLCEPLSGAQGTLCAINSATLPPPKDPIPEQVLEVQMAVFRRD